MSPRRLLAAKAIAAMVPVLILSQAVAVTVSVATGGSWLEIAAMLVLVGWGTFGFVTIDTAAAAFAPNFEADHIQRSTELVGRAFGMVAGAVFGLTTAVAVGRLIFFATGSPAALDSAFAWETAGIRPLGWPLVITALAVACGVLVFVVRIAIDHIDDLIRNGP